jgi:hypothetical protein
MEVLLKDVAGISLYSADDTLTDDEGAVSD